MFIDTQRFVNDALALVDQQCGRRRILCGQQRGCVRDREVCRSYRVVFRRRRFLLGGGSNSAPRFSRHGRIKHSNEARDGC
jgi:hypothetical protein